MANPHRGEAEFEVGGTTYRVKFNWNAAAEYEHQSGRVLSDALADVVETRLSATSLRAMLWAGLREHHRDVTLEAAGRLLDALGRRRAIDMMGVALQYYYPEIASDADPQTPAPSA